MILRQAVDILVDDGFFPKRMKEAQIKDDQPLNSLALDSYALMSLVMTIEDLAHVHFDADELTGLRTVGDLVRVIESRSKEPGS